MPLISRFISFLQFCETIISFNTLYVNFIANHSYNFIVIENVLLIAINSNIFLLLFKLFYNKTCLVETFPVYLNIIF